MISPSYRRFFALSVIVLVAALCGCKPDLIVSEFTVGTATPNTDEHFYLAPATIKVKNIGDDPCKSDFSVLLSCFLDPDLHPYYYFTVPGRFEEKTKWQCKALDVDEEETWIGTIYISPFAYMPDALLEITVDVDHEIKEKNENNNSTAARKSMPPWPEP